MKKTSYLTLIFLAANCIFAQTNAAEHEWKATLKVVDENGSPVAGANVGVGYYIGNTSKRIDGLTDTNGIFVAAHSANTSGYAVYDLAFIVEKTGYYRTWQKQDLGVNYDTAKWNPNMTIVLEKIINPIPMYARRAQIEIPVVDKPVGFDLVESDWVAPYGKGKQSDIIFMTTRRWDSRHDFDAAVKITFPDSGDGLLVASVPPVVGSAGPRMPVMAPLEGYIAEQQVRLSNTPANGWKGNDGDKQNYYIRVRTVLAPNGDVKSALYGKIYGGFTLDPINSKTTLILFTYYLNPTLNSRNVEFNPGKNLFQGLPFIEQVKEP